MSEEPEIMVAGSQGATCFPKSRKKSKSRTNQKEVKDLQHHGRVDTTAIVADRVLIGTPRVAFDPVNIRLSDPNKPETEIENSKFKSNQQPFKHSNASRSNSSFKQRPASDKLNLIRFRCIFADSFVNYFRTISGA